MKIAETHMLHRKLGMWGTRGSSPMEISTEKPGNLGWPRAETQHDAGDIVGSASLLG